jgi:exopolysaccharide biosynthesis polyprenyl glycosylphosphotransferase
LTSKHKILLLFADVILIVITIIIFSYSYIQLYGDIFAQDGKDYLYTSLTLILLIIIGFYLNRLYKYNVILKIIAHTIAIIKAMILSCAILIFIAFTLKAEDILINRLYWLSLFLYITVMFLFIRVLLVPAFYTWVLKRKYVVRKVLVVGGGAFGNLIIEKLKSDSNYFNVVGVVDDDPLKRGIKIDGITVLGNLNDIDSIIKKFDIKDIFIAINRIDEEKLSLIIKEVKKYNRRIHVGSKLYNNVIDRCEIEDIGGFTFFRITNATASPYYLFMKRVMDLTLSVFVLVFLFPFLLTISLIIKITSQGPVFYKAVVIGKEGKPFSWYKFRSMVQNDEKQHIELVKKVIASEETAHKLTNDPRITSIGRFIRRFGIDELPQIINVLRGEMSFVGPRPKLEYEYKLMEEWQKLRFSVIPGISGLYQIKGKNDIAFKDEIVMDIYYIENRSIKMDIEIALRTIPFLIFGNNK